MVPCGEAGPLFARVALGPPAGHGRTDGDPMMVLRAVIVGSSFSSWDYLPGRCRSIPHFLPQALSGLGPVRSCCSGQTSRGHTSLCRLIRLESRRFGPGPVWWHTVCWLWPGWTLGVL